MNVTYSVYHIHIKPSLDEGYIGITKNTEQRFFEHRTKIKQRNVHLNNALQKYGDAVQFSVVASDLAYEAACLLEKMLRPKPNMGWNIAVGGDVPPNPKGKQRSEEHRANISKAKIGKKNPMFGKNIVFSEQHKKKISDAMKGKKSPMKGKTRPLLTCPHCNKVGGAGGMYISHFDRCKNKKNESI